MPVEVEVHVLFLKGADGLLGRFMFFIFDFLMPASELHVIYAHLDCTYWLRSSGSRVTSPSSVSGS